MWVVYNSRRTVVGDFGKLRVGSPFSSEPGDPVTPSTSLEFSKEEAVAAGVELDSDFEDYIVGGCSARGLVSGGGQALDRRRPAAWTPVEDAALLSARIQHGSRWTAIAKSLPGRTANQVSRRAGTLAKQRQELCKRQREDATSAGLASLLVPSESRQLCAFRPRPSELSHSYDPQQQPSSFRQEYPYLTENPADALRQKHQHEKAQLMANARQDLDDLIRRQCQEMQQCLLEHGIPIPN
jgi:hypothetical protein